MNYSGLPSVLRTSVSCLAQRLCLTHNLPPLLSTDSIWSQHTDIECKSVQLQFRSICYQDRDKVALALRERVHTLYRLAGAQGPRGSLSCPMTTQSPCPGPHEVIHVSPNLCLSIPALIMWLDNWAHDYASPAMTPSLPSHGENFLWR